MTKWRPSRQGVVIGCVLSTAWATVWLAMAGAQCRAVEAGFWFEEVTFSSGKLGGPITRQEMATLVSMARAEVRDAFAGLNITFMDRRDTAYRVRVVQDLRDQRFRRLVFIPAETRAASGLGGQGAVSFSWLASSAVVYAPEDADRATMIQAIARGIGRTAVHEFVHVLLPHVPIHDSKDIRSYEYHSAARREQYFGDMRWDLARPLLQERLGPCTDGWSS
jgi:hypothetical protein